MLDEYLSILDMHGVTLEKATERLVFWDSYKPNSEASYWLQQGQLSLYRCAKALLEADLAKVQIPPLPSKAGQVFMDYLFDLNEYARKLENLTKHANSLS